ncbi:cytochrome P450 [Mycena capillaripes]|nr:cytochrome P450 [Mycena capillaripes]
MREEAERQVAAEGWTKKPLDSMHKIDSFLRSHSASAEPCPVRFPMGRQVIAKDGFRFSDGTTIPYGSFLSVPGIALQSDPDNCDHPDRLDGFRFSRLRESAKRENLGMFNRHMVTTAEDHVVFGHGRHACPGRFFVATQLKALLAHLLINHDITAETDVRPPDIRVELITLPNPKGKI